jgi:hypothetical protein
VVGTGAVTRGGDDALDADVAASGGLVVEAAAVVLEASCGAVVELVVSGSEAGEVHASRQVNRAGGAARQTDIRDLFVKPVQELYDCVSP